MTASVVDCPCSIVSCDWPLPCTRTARAPRGCARTSSTDAVPGSVIAAIAVAVAVGMGPGPRRRGRGSSLPCVPLGALCRRAHGCARSRRRLAGGRTDAQPDSATAVTAMATSAPRRRPLRRGSCERTGSDSGRCGRRERAPARYEEALERGHSRYSCRECHGRSEGASPGRHDDGTLACRHLLARRAEGNTARPRPPVGGRGPSGPSRRRRPGLAFPLRAETVPGAEHTMFEQATTFVDLRH